MDLARSIWTCKTNRGKQVCGACKMGELVVVGLGKWVDCSITHKSNRVSSPCEGARWFERKSAEELMADLRKLEGK